MLTGNETLKDIPLDQLKEYLQKEEEKARWSCYIEDAANPEAGTIWVDYNSETSGHVEGQLGFNPKNPGYVQICHPRNEWKNCPIEIFEDFVDKIRRAKDQG